MIIPNLIKRVNAKHEEQLKRGACQADSTVHFFPESSIFNELGPERIQIGAHSFIRGEFMLSRPSGNIRVGSNCFIGDHTRIWSTIGVTIGNHVLIAHSANILDNDSHPMSASQRRSQFIDIFFEGQREFSAAKMAPIVIEDDAWIGFNASILKGVRIGKGAVIGSNSVVTKDVPPYAIMVGNPARQIGTAPE